MPSLLKGRHGTFASQRGGIRKGEVLGGSGLVMVQRLLGLSHSTFLICNMRMRTHTAYKVLKGGGKNMLLAQVHDAD